MNRMRHDAERTRDFFDGWAPYWREVYAEQGLQGYIYRQRLQKALEWVDELQLPAQAAVLDAGCGAGLLTVELAERGFRVTATDNSSPMIELAEQHAAARGVSDRVRLLLADGHRLPLASCEFDAVVALGLLPWVQDEPVVVAEMARVLRPAGHLIASADNRMRLNILCEPRENPALAPLKIAVRIARCARGRPQDGVPSHLHRPAQVDRFLTAAGLAPMRRCTVGFGPFTFLGKRILNERAGLGVHLRAARMRALRRHGWHYLVQARKPEPRP